MSKQDIELMLLSEKLVSTWDSEENTIHLIGKLAILVEQFREALRRAAREKGSGKSG